VREAGIALVAGCVYFLIRGSVADRADEAMSRAVGMIDLERALGLFWEPRVQGWILDSRPLIDLANGIYFWTHMPVIVLSAVWLYWRRRSVYRRIRNAFVVSAALALALYFLIPVAPPRFFPELGFVDTMALYAEANYQAQEVGPFVNAYAAVPSLHFGWALLIGVAWWWARPGGRVGGLLVGALAAGLVGGQFLAIIATGNHFVLDAAAGTAVAAIALAVVVRPVPWRGSSAAALKLHERGTAPVRIEAGGDD